MLVTESQTISEFLKLYTFFILTLQGTTPANPKDAEGEIWVDDSIPVEETPAPVESDSTVVEVDAADEQQV